MEELPDRLKSGGLWEFWKAADAEAMRATLGGDEESHLQIRKEDYQGDW